MTAESRSTLAELAALHGTDKLAHGYLAHYEHHFASLRDRPVRLLEIGIGPGGSLSLWQDYFERGAIAGLDINDKREFAAERIAVHRGDQSDAGLLRRIVAELGGVDVVIDDGSHVNAHVLASFTALFPLLSDGGWYVIEDMHTSYWSGFGGDHRDLDSGRTSASLVKSMIDGLNCHWIPGREPRERDLAIAAVHCYPKIAFISKGANPRAVRPFDSRHMEATLTEAAGRPSGGKPQGGEPR